MHAVHVVPVWLEDGQPHVCLPGETRRDPEVVGWASVGDLTVDGERRLLLLLP